MNKIPQDKLENLSQNAGKLVGVINESLQWVNNHLKEETLLDTNYDLKKYRRTLNKVKAVVTEKPTVALFGASQVGKSYMANSLLYNKKNKLLITNHKGVDNAVHNYEEKVIDFLQKINPIGEQNEATGVITRFTATREADDKRLAIKVKVLSPKDIITIICDTYFQEFYENDSKKSLEKEQVQKCFDDLQKYINKNSIQHFLTDDDVYEIQEYLEKHFPKKNKTLLFDLLRVGYWNFLAENVRYIAPEHWANVFSILWNTHTELSDLLSISISTLQKIMFEREIWVGFEAVVRGESSIMDVATLKNFFKASPMLKIQRNNYGIVEIEAPKLSFITLEVILSVDQSCIDNRPFIKDVDIVDFPGARARGEIQNLSPDSLNIMLLRGKVSYLFNNYSANFKTNTLLVCMRTAQTDVKSVPGLLNNWIEDNLGNTPKKRSDSITSNPPPLFIIFTWWNTQLGYEPTSGVPNPDTRLKTQFEKCFEGEIMGEGWAYDWNKKWTEVNGQIRRFSNFYLLRDFARSKEFFLQNRDDKDQFMNELQENYFENEAKQQYYKDYEKKFLEYHKSKELFFENPEQSFLEASIPGKDGSEFIIKNLIPIASNTVSVPIYMSVLNNALEDAKKELAKHYHDDSKDEQIRKAAQDSSDIKARMNSVFGSDAYYFGNFIEHLTISENEIVGFYHPLLQSTTMVHKKDLNKYILFRANSPKLSTDKTFDENLEVIREDYNKISKEDAQKYFTEKEALDLEELFYGNLHDLQDNSQTLADEARNYWVKTKLDLNNFTFFIEKGLEKGMLTKLFDNMRTSFDKLKITKQIAQEIRDYVDGPKKIDEAEDMIAHITAGKINEFVTSMGWSYLSHAEKQKIRDSQINNNLNIRIPNDQEIFESLEKIVEPDSKDMSLEKLIDFMQDLNKKLNEKPLDIATLLYTPMVKNYQRWSELMRISFIATCDIPTYDTQANDKLGTILDKFKDFSFSV